MTRLAWLKPNSRSRKLIMMGVLFFAALVPRLTAVDRYITPDELIWVFRSVQFHQALANGQWLNTLTAGHPGVMTTWLGALGIHLQLLLQPEVTAVYEWITHLAWFAPENMAMFQQLNIFLTFGRLITAVVNSLGVLLFFQFSRRLFGLVTAILGSFLLAWDPFVVGLSGLLHVDGLLMTFVCLALLTLALTLTNRDSAQRRAQLGYPCLLGFFTGLAILTKTPALLLLPFCSLFLFLSLWRERDVNFNGRVRRVMLQGSVWLGSCLLTTFILFPALWVSPLQVLNKMSGTSNRHIEEALRPTFFMGELSFEHGFQFYPVVISFRLSPLVFCGLILAVFLIIKAIYRRQKQLPWFDLPTWIFILWPILFVLGISLAAKKFDRYALPVIPSLILIASLAWTSLPAWQKSLKNKVVPLLIGAQLVLLIWFLPYPLSTMNVILGGPWLGQHVLDVGWGESVSAAARWLNQQENTETNTAVTGIPPAVAPYFAGTTLNTTPENEAYADFAIVSLNGATAIDNLPGEIIHTIHYNGLDRALVLAQDSTIPLPQPDLLADALIFDEAVQLLALGPTAVDDHIRILTTWQLTQPTNGRYTIRLTLADEDGNEWAQLETALLNETYFYPEHWRPDAPAANRYDLSLPPAISPGDYKIKLALFNEKDGSQLPWRTAANLATGLTYEQSVLIDPSPRPASLANFEPSLQKLGEWLDGRLALYTLSDSPPELVVTGGKIVFDLIWQATDELPADMDLHVSLADQRTQRPLSQYNTGQWRPGETIHEKVTLAIPPDAEPGAFAVVIQPALADGTTLPALQSETTVDIIALDRLFSLPPDILILRQDNFADWLTLAGVDRDKETAVSGTTHNLTLYWQVDQVPPELVSTFVHLLDEEGNILTQSDQWPGGLPVDLWAERQVIVDRHALEIPAELEAGTYQLHVGLYWSDDGTRLTLPNGQDGVMLPVPVQVETRP